MFNLEEDRTSDSLGFEEMHCEYFIRVNERMFLAFPLVAEAHLAKGFYVEFKHNWRVRGTQSIADMAPGTMRPTPVVLNHPDEGVSILLCGGRSDRSS